MFTDIWADAADAFREAFTGIFDKFGRDRDKDDDGEKSAWEKAGDWISSKMPWNREPGQAVYGDTPHAIQAGIDGLAARFAGGDYIVAAQSPAVLLQQALDNFIKTSTPNVPFSGMDQMNMGGASMPPIDIAVIAEGRLLDAVQVTALDRGHAPRLERKLRRASGVNVGFNRGRFNNFGR